MLQIERRSLTPLVGSQNPWLENYWNMEYYPTQYKLLQSRGLAERVVQEPRLVEDPSFNPGAAAAAPAAPAAEDDEAVLGGLADRLRGGLSVEPVRATQLVTLAYRSPTPSSPPRSSTASPRPSSTGDREPLATAGNASTFLPPRSTPSRRRSRTRRCSSRPQPPQRHRPARPGVERHHAAPGSAQHRLHGRHAQAHPEGGALPRGDDRPQGVDRRQPLRRPGHRPRASSSAWSATTRPG